MTAKTGQTPSQRYAGLAANFGSSAYARQGAPATREQKATLGTLDASQVKAASVGGEAVTSVLTTAQGNNAPIGGLKRLVRGAPFGHEGLLQDLRQVPARRGPPAPGPARCPNIGRRGAEVDRLWSTRWCCTITIKHHCAVENVAFGALARLLYGTL